MHIKDHYRLRMYMVEWLYTLGYKIHNRATGPPTRYCHPSTDDAPSSWRSRGGWRSICWGSYNDDENYNSPK